MAARPNTPLRPIIVKKVIEQGHGAHHGGAWKVAYADFVTAMMAFFLLMWLLGATTEKQRKALADYFAPTIVQAKQDTAGSNGLFGGESLVSVDKYPHEAGQTGTRAMTIPRDASGGPREAVAGARARKQFQQVAQSLMRAIEEKAELRRLAANIRFTETREGLRIDIVDDADFSMFVLGTSQLTPEASRILTELAKIVAGLPNELMIRGHTDAAQWSAGAGTNNWRLSVERSEVARQYLVFRGVGSNRFARIEGVADREPYVPSNRFDPRNRRISVTLGWAALSDN